MAFAVRRWWLAAVAALVIVGLFGVYAIRVIPGSTASASTDFRTRYGAAVTEFRTDTEALRAEGQRVAGSGTVKVLPVYVHLRDATERARKRFAALHPPKQQAKSYDVFVSLLAEQAKTLDAVVTAAGHGAMGDLATALQHYAVLVADWLTARQQLDAAL